MTPSEDTPPPALRVIFVCTANVARSPYAERRAQLVLRGLPLTFASAGSPGFPGRTMDEDMADELRFRGGTPSGHVSRSLSDELMAEADLVLTFEYAQRLRVIATWPDQAAKVFGLRQFADALARLNPPVGSHQLPSVADPNAPDSMALDIEDPHGRGAEAAFRCADEIDEALRRLARAMGSEPVEYPTRAARHRGRRRHRGLWR